MIYGRSYTKKVKYIINIISTFHVSKIIKYVKK